MNTFTLKANVNDLTGVDSTRVTTVKIRTLPGPVSEMGGAHATFEWETIKTIANGVLEVLLPQNAVPSGYIFHVSFPQLDGMWWEVPPAATADAIVWLSDYTAGVAVGAYAARPAIDHGNVSGTVDLSSAYGLHELNMTGDTVLNPVGPAGIDMEVRVTGTGTLTLASGVLWDSTPIVVPGTMLLTHWLSAGWRAVAVAPVVLTPVTPAAVTFTDSGINRIIVPSTTGVIYMLDGSPLTAGNHDGYATAQFVNVTWVPATGYVSTSGHDTDHWSHTFGTLAASPTDPFAVGSVGVYYNPSLAGALVGTGLSMTVDDAGPDDYDMDQGGSVAVAVTSVNSKTTLGFTALTQGLRHLSFPAGKGVNATGITTWIVMKMNNGGFNSTTGFNIGISNTGSGSVWALRAAPAPATPFIELAGAYTVGDVVIAAATVPASGNTKLWVGGQTPQVGLTNLAAGAHLFVGPGPSSVAQFDFCAGGTFNKILTDAEFAGLRAWATAQWGAT